MGRAVAVALDGICISMYGYVRIYMCMCIYIYIYLSGVCNGMQACVSAVKYVF